MTTLYSVLSGIIDSGYAIETLADANQVVSYAESCGIDVTTDQAESIIRVAAKLNESLENGNGEWDRMHNEAKKELECYMHLHSGDVATREMWFSDFEATDVESWFGRPAEECEGLDWLDDLVDKGTDKQVLTEVEFVNGEWVEV